ncbi:HEXXH motif-containing putative peptide modification protein [Actinoplanes sp. NPDC024001]|uniref:aKG-HExxH-type peptide beta-hydroxylase n=1 Tax=Actinoplanes sp. NPDC024001 TaxID=3154598 RepID=UPI0033D57C3A
MSPRTFRLTDSALAALGAGRPDADTLGTLRRAQLSRHLLLLREIRRAQPEAPAWFARLTAADPDEARRLIADPMTGLWAAHTLRDGASADGPRPGGHSLHTTCADLTLTVRVDDADPLRHLLGLTPAGPLSGSELAHWQRCLDDAWRILVTRHRPAAETMAAVLRVIVPVRPDPAAEGISATSAEAFGAVAMSPPADGTALAVGLLHEVQHSVLNAVHQLFDLVQPGGAPGYSPWRDDPRPPLGILHGAYAYLAVTRFWRAEAPDARVAGAVGGVAGFEFARWREAVMAAAEGLLAGGHLTAAGTRFVTALADEARPWLADAVEPEVARLAGLAGADHRVRWRLRNLTVAAEDVAALAAAWRAGQPPVRVRSVPTAAPGRALENSPRVRLARTLARGDAGRGESDPVLTPGGRAAAADRACLRGEHGAAENAYEECLDRDRGDDRAWSGLALVSPHRAVRERPEVVKALASALPEAEIGVLADWLAG